MQFSRGSVPAYRSLVEEEPGVFSVRSTLWGGGGVSEFRGGWASNRPPPPFPPFAEVAPLIEPPRLHIREVGWEQKESMETGEGCHLP